MKDKECKSIKLEVKKIDKKIELDTSTEACNACMHYEVLTYGTSKAYQADISSCYGVRYDRQHMPFWLG